MFNIFPPVGPTLHHRRQPGLIACLLTTTLLSMSAVPASASPYSRDTLQAKSPALQKDYSGLIRNIDPLITPQLSSNLSQENYAELIRAIEAYPEVVVFPIQVAGSFTATASRKVANKVAQASGTAGIAVIYPDIGEPYRSVFAQIINGIEDRANGHVANFAVGPNVNIDALSNSLHLQDTKVVIALGRQGVKVASALGGDFGVVAGGVLMSPENEMRNIQVNSLAPDPALLFSRLKGLMPKVRRVFTVYDPHQNEWMMRLAKEAALAQGLELVAYQAGDLRSAMHAYQEIFADIDGSQDALWLPQDSTTVEESTVMPMVLKESWDRDLAVFSSSFGHVRRGVLFSLYPNNVELGRYLAGSALGLLSSKENGAGMLPLREVLMAVNLRTARHLGVKTDRPQSFDMAFPEQ